MPLYGIAVHHICTNFVFYILLTSLPTYFSTILRFNLQQVRHDRFRRVFLLHPTIRFRMESCLLFRTFAILSSQSFLVTRLIAFERKVFFPQQRRDVGKQLSVSIGEYLFMPVLDGIRLGACGTSLFLVLVGVIGCNHVLAVVFISLSIAFIGFQASGSLISHLDIASNYAGTLVGITNMLASVPGFVGPMFVGWMTENNVNPSRTLFLTYFYSLSFSKPSKLGDGFSTYQPV